MLERPSRRARNPKRDKPTGSISVRWALYDELDALAEATNMSLGMTVEALLKEHQKKSLKNEDYRHIDRRRAGGVSPAPQI